MSQQNVKEWKDRNGKLLDIGQRIVAVRGSTLHVGEILWFTKSGVTIASEKAGTDLFRTVSIGIYQPNKEIHESFLIL
jgi:hypothetical protein